MLRLWKLRINNVVNNLIWSWYDTWKNIDNDSKT